MNNTPTDRDAMETAYLESRPRSLSADAGSDCGFSQGSAYGFQEGFQAGLAHAKAWRPIEEAPGNIALLVWCGGIPTIATRYPTIDGKKWLSDGTSWEIKPEYWQFIAPPEQKP